VTTAPTPQVGGAAACLGKCPSTGTAPHLHSGLYRRDSTTGFGRCDSTLVSFRAQSPQVRSGTTALLVPRGVVALGGSPPARRSVGMNRLASNRPRSRCRRQRLGKVAPPAQPLGLCAGRRSRKTWASVGRTSTKWGPWRRPGVEPPCDRRRALEKRFAQRACPRHPRQRAKPKVRFSCTRTLSDSHSRAAGGNADRGLRVARGAVPAAPSSSGSPGMTTSRDAAGGVTLPLPRQGASTLGQPG
jgi:hypothetical protein